MFCDTATKESFAPDFGLPEFRDKEQRVCPSIALYCGNTGVCPPVAPAFGGPDLKTLFITAGGHLWSCRVDAPGVVSYPANR